MKKMLFIFIVFTGCQFQYGNEEYIDPILLPYLETFKLEAERLNVQLPEMAILMYFEEMEKNNGLCNYTNKYMNIKIDPKIFKNGFDKYDLLAESTIFHELAHGYLNRDHIQYNTEIEPSLMSVPHKGRIHWVDGTMREYYLNELFNIL